MINIENDLENLFDDLKKLKKIIKAETVKQISKKALRVQAANAGTLWHKNLKLKLDKLVSKEIRDKYDDEFTKLITISSPNNLRTSYLAILNNLTSTFRDDFIIPSKQGVFAIGEANVALSAFDSFFASLEANENEYLQEAKACAQAGHLRAAAVLGWCATINRIHQKIEILGFQSFNETSKTMANQQAGRFKKFTKAQQVNSISEMREVFDNIILWILEGMQLIDSNQHTRLRSCFDIRCQSAHPGDAPITQYNLLSFFSDLDQIILSNPKFSIN